MEGRSKSLKWLYRTILWLVSTLFVFTLFSAAGITQLDVSQIFIPRTKIEPAAEENPAAGAIKPKSSQAKIVIRSLDIVSPIVFPASTELAELKAALGRGAVHYPLSAFPHEARGNVFLFGHSSSRPFESNPAHTIFTRLGELEPGTEIEIWYRDRAYTYRVHTVKILKPWEAEVYFATSGRRLTLSTCWPVGDPTNRFIVEAVFVKSSPLPSTGSATERSPQQSAAGASRTF